MPSPEPGAPPPPATGGLTIFPVTGLGDVLPGDDLGALLAGAARRGLGDGSPGGGGLAHGDVVVVTQKVVSKAEGRLVDLDGDDREARARLIEAESVRVVRRRGDLVISETSHGFVCANAGVDLSNVAAGTAALLPLDPDLSARRIRAGLRHRCGVSVGVVISDTFGRAWRNGVTDVAIGIAGVAGVVDLRGTADANGRPLEVTEVCIADELAGAAELVMGKNRGIPAAVVRGVDPRWLRSASAASEIVRSPAEDLFR
jgi:coenzyme F420-0:L-glutamate ligase/coenzyme F420-1:gamma-L-glutamate ligase